MICPACGNELTQITVGDLEVDACKGGCGGIWFDWFELSKVDEPNEAAGETLLEIERDENCRVDMETKRHCPKCGDMPMMRHFFGVKRMVAVDECPQCAGFWLDAGELKQIRETYISEEEARAAAAKEFGKIIEQEFGDIREVSEAKRQKARKFAHAFRFLCPSYYIPGKQEGAAY
ncbi:MAG: zf-TFIIB domain-containing protein [bacterium]|nr:zf-TFIIB domain-containing protein [bacterium]